MKSLKRILKRGGVITAQVGSQDKKPKQVEKWCNVLEKNFDNDPISVPRLIHEVWEAVKDKPYVVANRNYRSWYEGIWKFKGCNQYLGNNAGGGVGYGPGGVVGSALAARDMGRFTVCIMGDGDFSMNPAALWSAAHYKIPVLIVLHNNNSFGNDEEHQSKLAKYRGRPPENAWIGQAMRDPIIDFAKVARGAICPSRKKRIWRREKPVN